jgi:hypothetical protein
MEFLPGETLRHRLQRCGPCTPEVALPLVVQLAAALAAAHAAGVVHRDLKSDNIILVEESGSLRAAITDFGLARPVRECDGELSSAGKLIGTAAYMAPEQVLSEPITAAVDIYALGVVMFELVTGQLPFRAGSSLATALARLQQRAPAPRSLAPDLDPQWDAVILKCLERNPADRFLSADEIACSLTAARRARLPPRLRRRGLRIGAALLFAMVALCAARLARKPPKENGRPVPPNRPATATVSALPAPTEPASVAAPLSRLVVRAGVKGAVVKIDNYARPSPRGKIELEIDSERSHRVEVTAPGYRPWRKVVTAAPGATLDLKACLQERPPKAAPSEPAIGNNVVDPYEEAP